MSDYAKLEARFVHSANSSYSDALVDRQLTEYAITPDEVLHLPKVEAATAGTTITTSFLASATMLAIKNLDTTNYVTAVLTNTSGSVSIVIHAKSIFATSDFVPASNIVLTANTAACLCELILCGT